MVRSIHIRADPALPPLASNRWFVDPPELADTSTTDIAVDESDTINIDDIMAEDADTINVDDVLQAAPADVQPDDSTLTSSMHGALKLANAMSQGVLAERVTNLIEASMAAASAAAAAAADVSQYGGYGGGGGEMSQLDTPGQAPHQHYSAPPSYVAPAVVAATAAPSAAEDANPFARRKSVAAASDEDENKGGGAQLAGTKVKAGYEANAPAAKKGRVANPFARR